MPEALREIWEERAARRNDCGGCHAHSQKPTDFKLTAAAKPDYAVFDLTGKTPLLTTKAKDESKQKWDATDETGVRYQPGAKTVEYHRDVKPIFERSCVPCHSGAAAEPAGLAPREKSAHTEVSIVKPGGTGIPRAVISAASWATSRSTRTAGRTCRPPRRGTSA